MTGSGEQPEDLMQRVHDIVYSKLYRDILNLVRLIDRDMPESPWSLLGVPGD